MSFGTASIQAVVIAVVATRIASQGCGFSQDPNDGTVTFSATRKGECSISTNSTINQLVVFTIDSYAFSRDTTTDQNCVNYFQGILNNHRTYGPICGTFNTALSRTFVLYARSFELKVTTEDIHQDSRLQVHLKEIESILSCDFDDIEECPVDQDMHRTTFQWVNELCGQSTNQDYFYRSVGQRSLLTLNIGPSRDIVVYFSYSFTNCQTRAANVPQLQVSFCQTVKTVTLSERTIQSGAIRSELAVLHCSYSSTKITFRAQSQSGTTVSVDDIFVWDLNDAGNNVVSGLPMSFPTTSTSSRTYTKTSVPVHNSDSISTYVPSTMTNRTPKGAAQVNPLLYVVPVLVLVAIAIVGTVLVVLFRRKKNDNEIDGKASASYNNRAYESGSPVRINTRESQENGIVSSSSNCPPNNHEEVYNPVYQPSAEPKDDREEMYSSICESSDTVNRSEQQHYTGAIDNIPHLSATDHTYAEPKNERNTGNEYHYTEYAK